MVMLTTAATLVNAQEKLKPEEVVAKHLDALGSAENRAPARSRILAGSSVVALKTGGSGQAEGPATISSQNDTTFVDANFEAPDFPYERISFDGKKVDVRQYKPGSRSPIGDFILSNDEIIKEGMFGGVLSSNWALLHTDARKPKLRYEGTQTLDGKTVHTVRYQPRRSSDLKVKMFFDAETFHHVRTEYEQSIAAQMSTGPMRPGAQQETRFKIIETFSDFAESGGLTLPKKYNVEYSVFSGKLPLLIEWTFNFSRFAFNQPLELDNFKSGKN
jgi:hypothetical protein